MRGYKALDNDMKAVNGNGMQYETGKTYSTEGKVVPCRNGFHFCDRIEKLNEFYPISESRIFEVEADGEIANHGEIYVAENITLIRELSRQEIKDYFKRNQEELAESDSPYIKQALAEQGYGLDILIRDEDWFTRCIVACQGYGLDVLVHDAKPFVRHAVAHQGYGLDTLIRDEEWLVRSEVARQGYGLDILIQDENPDVRKLAQEMLEGR